MAAINFFQVSANDKSLEYLGELFGNMNGLLPVDYETILGRMFETFNTILLAVGALIIVYMTVVGVMMTAHEGEFMKKWNSLWTPLRAVFGIAALFPTPSGYSGIQLIMMWVIIQGVGAADQLWTTALQYVSVMGSVGAKMKLPDAGAKTTFAAIFKASTCAATASRSSKLPVETLQDAGSYYCEAGGVWCKGGLNSFKANLTLAFLNNNRINFGPEGGCGKLTVCNKIEACTPDPKNPDEKRFGPDTNACKACTKQHEILPDMVNTLTVFGLLIAMTDYDYMNYYYKGYYQPWGTWEITSIKPDPEFPIPSYVAKFCAANPTNPLLGPACRGPIGFEPKTAQEEADQDADEKKEEKVRRGTIPDPKAGKSGAPSGLAKAVYYDYVIKPMLVAGEIKIPNFLTIDLKKWVGGDKGPDLIANMANDYVTQISAAAGILPENYEAAKEADLNTTKKQIKEAKLEGKLLEAQDWGWIFAGAYFYYIVQDNSAKIKNSMPDFEMVSINPESAGDDSGMPDTMKGYRHNYGAAGAIVAAMSPDGGGNYGAIDLDVVDEGGKAIGGMMRFATQSSEVNPLVQTASAGYGLLLSGQILFIIYLTLSFVLGLVSGINATVLGTGATNPMFVASPMMWMVITPMIGALLGIIVSMGAMLGVYMPLIPYMIYTFGAIGWLTSTIETMVAGPLVALGILAPGGHHEILGKAEPALMLMFNVFLRPTLMVFAYIASILLSTVVVKMINTAFWPLVALQIAATGASAGKDTSDAAGATALAFNPLMLVFFLVAYVGMIVSALNKTFAAIHIIPERVMRWIGGQGDQYGESEAVGEMKSGVTGAASSAGQGALARGGDLKGGGESVGTTQEKKKHWDSQQAKKGQADVSAKGGDESKD